MSEQRGQLVEFERHQAETVKHTTGLGRDNG